ncbi:hypothetical protein F2P56_021896, partial [Juglans regia]
VKSSFLCLPRLRKNQMVEKLNAMELENRTKEAVAVVFREVLGNRPGYSRGLGEMVMPETSGTQQGGENATGTSHDAQYYKAELEALRANVREILEKQAEFDKFMTYSMSQQQSLGESLRETWGAV